MPTNRAKAFMQMLRENFGTDDLDAVSGEIAEAEAETENEDEKEHYRAVRELIERVQAGESAEDVVRGTVFGLVRESLGGEPESFSFLDADPGEPPRSVLEKRNEIYEILDHLNESMSGRGTGEAVAAFSSMLEIVSQFCLQKTDGVIAIRLNLGQIFNTGSSPTPPALNQDLTLLYTPEEIAGVQRRLSRMRDGDPMLPLLTAIMDQAYDVVQFNEMTGNLLLLMTQYFLEKLEGDGHGAHPLTLEYRTRHDRCKISLKRAVDELCEIEMTINHHLARNPVLREMPKLLRALIKIRLGLMDKKYIPAVLRLIASRNREYGRARRRVSHDFNRLPHYQHVVRVKQGNILKLQKDVTAFMIGQYGDRLRSLEGELERILESIETANEKVSPDSPEYKQLIEKKARFQRDIQSARNNLDVAQCQRKLVGAQHSLMTQAIKRYQKKQLNYHKLEQQTASAPKIPAAADPPRPESKSSANRMAHSSRKG